MTIYLPDDLAADVKAAEDLNVSAVCQGALQHELARRATAAKVDEGMSREVFLIESPEHGLVNVAFTGRLLAGVNSSSTNLSVYVTARHRIAIYDADRQVLEHYDDLDDAEAAGWDPMLLAAAGDELGEDRVAELDI